MARPTVHPATVENWQNHIILFLDKSAMMQWSAHHTRNLEAGVKFPMVVHQFLLPGPLAWSASQLLDWNSIIRPIH